MMNNKNIFLNHTLQTLIIFTLSLSLILPPIVFESFFALLVLIGLFSFDRGVFHDKKLFFSQLIYFIAILLVILYHKQNVGRLISGFYVVFAAFILARVFDKNRVNLASIVYGCSLATFGGFMVACYQFFIQKLGTDIHGFTNRVQFGDIAILLGVMGLSFSNKSTNRLTIFCGWLSFAFGLLASIISGSRGSWSVLPFIGVLYLYLFSVPLVKFWKYISAILIVFMVALFVTGQYHRFGMIFVDLQNYSTNANLSSNSIGSRMEMWKASLDMFKEHPLLGVGDWQTALPSLENSINSSIIMYNQPHNEYLRNLAMFGLCGFIPFMLFISAALYAIRLENRI